MYLEYILEDLQEYMEDQIRDDFFQKLSHIKTLHIIRLTFIHCKKKKKKNLKNLVFY